MAVVPCLQTDLLVEAAHIYLVFALETSVLNSFGFDLHVVGHQGILSLELVGHNCLGFGHHLH